ncbi:MAG: hypothetical protein Q7S41_01355 [Candidatus Limnocylindria bacterium]|nr:hypothetical protein [Candidatus Limnocylindria bacterium]
MGVSGRRAIIAAFVAIALAASACSDASRSAPVATTGAAAPANPAMAGVTATATPSEAPLEITGKFGVSPVHGPWGTTVAASASGFKAQTTYDVVWTTVTGKWVLSADQTEYKGRQYTPAQKILKRVTTDAGGSFVTTFTVPENDFGFQHDVLVLDGTNIIRNKAGFDVDLEVTISPKSGPVGTPITIEARGIGWRQLQNSWLVSYDNSFTGWLSSVTTKGYAKAVIPATGDSGTHVVTILHGDFTFPYLNMQQSPEPGRPMFRLPFTVTDGPGALPAAASAQALPTLATAPVTTGIWFDPPSGIVGAKTILRGTGLIPSAEFALEWTTTVGNRVSGSGFEAKADTIAEARTDRDGRLAMSFTVPNDLGGAHVLLLKRGDLVIAKTTFLIQPSIQPLKTDRGPSGTEITIQLNGVGWTETANIYNLTYDNAYAGYACGFNSGGNVQVIFRVSGAPGWHYIDLYPGIYKGAETRPLNFRVPQLTFADDHPGETLPAFHLAFFITGE